MKSYLYQVKDHEYKGRLREELAEMRRGGMSYRKVADALSSQGVSVGRTAVEEWCKALVEPPKKNKKGK